MYTSSTLDLCNQSVQIWQYFQIICSESSNGKGILRYFTLIKWCCMHCYFLSGIFCREGMLECLNMDKSPQCSECPPSAPCLKGNTTFIFIFIYTISKRAHFRPWLIYPHILQLKLWGEYVQNQNSHFQFSSQNPQQAFPKVLKLKPILTGCIHWWVGHISRFSVPSRLLNFLWEIVLEFSWEIGAEIWWSFDAALELVHRGGNLNSLPFFLSSLWRSGKIINQIFHLFFTKGTGLCLLGWVSQGCLFGMFLTPRI